MAKIPILSKICGVLSQRYFIAVMCMTGTMLTTLNKLVFLSLMKEMIYSSSILLSHPACPATHHDSGHRHDKFSSGVEEFLWGRKMQVYLLIGFPVGYFLGRLPIGLATDKFGAKTLFGYSVFIPAMMSIITPICARTSPYVMFANRVVNGIFATAQPSTMAYLAARWFPLHDRAFMLALMYVGFPFGDVLSYALTHVIMHTQHKWASLYYMTGLAGVIFSYFWQAFIIEDPFDHPYVTKEELKMLVKENPMYANDAELEPGWSWPWKSILTSVPLWSLAVVNMAYSWFHHFSIVTIPALYFPEVHQYQFHEHEKLASFLYTLMAAVMLTAGVLSDKLIKHRFFNITHITKIYFSLSCILGPMLMLGLTHSECKITTVFLYYIWSVLFLGFAFTSSTIAVISIAHNFVGIGTALTSTIGLITVPVEIQITYTFTTDGTLRQWKRVSYLVAAFCILTTAVFLKWGNCQPQPWNSSTHEGKKHKHINYDISTGHRKPHHKPKKHTEGMNKTMGTQVIKTPKETTAETPRIPE